jgi:unsaturated rhamnogalacturonyl hydrolase
MKIILFLFLVMINLVINAQSVFDKASVKAVMDKVNKYQLENPWKEFDDNWIRGTYYTGVMSCYFATDDKAYLNQCEAFCNSIKWKLPVISSNIDLIDSPGGGNLLTCGQTMLECYMVDKKKYKIESIISHLENPEIMNPVSNPIKWYYAYGARFVDGLFTGPPALAMLSTVTRDEKYLQWMETFFWDVFGKLYDIDENLFYRDHNFFPDCLEQRKNDPDWKGNNQVTAAGKKVLWSRGNGWAFAGIARILKYLPKNHASYKRYENVFKNMAQSLKSRQSEEGFWYPNLDDPKDVPVKETSGTCFFIYGLAYGINTGLLDRNEYLPIVEKAWKSVYTAVSDEGKVQWGQRVGDRPVMIKMEDSHEFVSGTFLLAASEVYKLKK